MAFFGSAPTKGGSAFSPPPSTGNSFFVDAPTRAVPCDLDVPRPDEPIRDEGQEPPIQIGPPDGDIFEGSEGASWFSCFPSPQSGNAFFGEAPSTSSGSFFDWGGDPYRGSVAADGGYSDPDSELSGYHFLTLTPGEEYTIAVIREEADLDPGMWVFSEHFTFEDFQASGEPCVST